MRYERLCKGLTLVELMVAIAVLGFISMLGWRGSDAITRARLALNQELIQTRGLQLAFAQLQVDCANTVDSNTLAGAAPLLIDASRITKHNLAHYNSSLGAGERVCLPEKNQRQPAT